jgi:LAO/AO transport system kinase
MPDELVQLVAGALAQDTRAAARLMSLMQNQPHRLPELFKAMAAHGATREPRLILGVTGAPGSGKSTLTDALIAECRDRRPDSRIGVVAVDPSSPFTGGAVLGDRVRMMRHATDPQVFVRSLATRGHLGGLTLGVKGVTRVMGLIGCDTVIIETVGVGQSEVEVVGAADVVVVVLAPGQGDSIQMLKAGLMEIGDVFVVNKADRPGADALHAQLIAMLQWSSEDQPKVFLVSATDRTGVPELVDHLDACTAEHAAAWRARRASRLSQEMREAILEEARRRIDAHLAGNGALEGQVQRLIRGDVTVAELSQELIEKTAHETGDRDVSH